MTQLAGTRSSLERIELQYEIEQALYHEAAVLDEHHYADWLNLLTDDVTYWIPIREARMPGDEASEFTKPDDAAFLNTDRRGLEARVYKLSTGFAWSEDPRSRTRHLITNVRIVETPSSDEVLAECNFVVYRTRLETDEDFWVGRRLDALRRTDGAWKIARREVYLDQTVLMSKNLSTFL